MAFRPRLSPGVAFSRYQRRYSRLGQGVTTRPGRQAPGLSTRARSSHRGASLGFADPEVAGTGQEKLSRRGFKQFLLSLASQESFSEMLPKLETLKPACEWLDAVAELGGIYTTLNAGKDFYLFLDGHLMPWFGEKDDYPFVSIGAGGRYEVSPFGYLDNKEPKPQVALVFRNGEFETILRDASKAAVAAFLEERSRAPEIPEQSAAEEVGAR